MFSTNFSISQKIFNPDLNIKSELSASIGVANNNSRKAIAFNITPCIGKTFRLNDLQTFDIDIGYRFMFTGDLDRYQDIISNNRNFSFSGLFIQSSYFLGRSSFGKNYESSNNSKYTINLGAGYGSFDYISAYKQEIVPRPEIPSHYIIKQLGSGYTISAEVLYNLYPNIDIGSGINYIFREDHKSYNSKVEFLMPYLTAKYDFILIKSRIFAKFAVGYGKARLKYHTDADNDSYVDASGIGIITSLGKSFNIFKSTALNLEAGYRFIQTNEVELDDSWYTLDEDRIHFSGPFAQTGFSFGL